jgi:hypothetical protein
MIDEERATVAEGRDGEVPRRVMIQATMKASSRHAS